MSNVYIQEPLPTGSLIIHTTYGDIEVELWCKEAPKACRNFIQLSLEGYYDETIFHRVVPKFIVQAGDPTGTGNGGESIWGSPFKVESHSRLSFCRRGLVGMVAVTEAGELTSQFFFTLDKTPELDKKNTLFGRVVGDTLYNLLRIGEVQVDPETERPLYPPKILNIEIKQHPFEDIIPRELPEVKERLLKARAVKEVKPKAITATAIKNKTLLSFQDDDDEDEDVTMSMPTKIQSSHDVLNDPSLSKKQIDPNATSSIRKVLSKRPAETEPNAYEQIKADQRSELEEIKKQVASVQKDLKSMDQIEPAPISDERHQHSLRQDSVAKLLGKKSTTISSNKSLLEQQRELYMQKNHVIIGKRRKDAVDDVNTLLTLNAFKEKLHSVDSTTTTKSAKVDPTKLVGAAQPEPAKILEICKLHGLVNCLSCKDTFGRQEDGVVTEEGWLMHRLVFDKEVGYREIREELTNLVVIDPKEKAKEILGKNKR